MNIIIDGQICEWVNVADIYLVEGAFRTAEEYVKAHVQAGIEIVREERRYEKKVTTVYYKVL